MAAHSPLAPLQPLRVPVNASLTLAGNVVYSACQWGLLVALARLGSPEMVGQFALGLAVSGPIMLLFSLQLRAVQATDAAGSNHFSEYLALRLLTSAIALGAIACVALFVVDGGAAALVVLLVGSTKILESVSDVYRGLMQYAERMDRVAVSMALRGLVTLPAFALALLLGGGLIAAVSAMMAASLVVWWGWDVRTARRLCQPVPGNGPARGALFGVHPRFTAPALFGLARTALPLGLVAMLLSLNSYAPQYAVKQLGTAELGIFAALLYTALASRVLIGAVGQSASPRLARLYESGNLAAFRKLHGKLLRVGIAVSLLALAGAALLGKPFLRLVYGPEYAAHSQLFVALCAVAGLLHLVSFQGYTVTAARYFRAQLPVSIAVAATTIATAFLLVPGFGAAGAAAALLCGALVQGAGYALLQRHALRQLELRINNQKPHAKR
jgi:O-antigen/teichoic acid export membrane protein